MSFRNILGRLMENSAWPLIFVFFLGMFPFAYVFLFHYPDERHYVDGALQMLDNNDYWLPRTADGELRLKKPILAYWLTAISFKCLGISELAARLPFLLAACMILWLTWRMGGFVFNGAVRASWTMAILLGHFPFIVAAQRSLPDILLCLGLLLAAYGALQLLLRKQLEAMPFILFYGGVFGALQSKGMLALVFLAYCWGYGSLVKPDYWLRGGKWHAIGIMFTAFLGGAWFAWVGLHHADALNAFVDDQVAEKLEINPLKVFSRWLFYFVNYLILGFLPWIIALIYAKSGGTAVNIEKIPYLPSFIIGWSLLCILLFGFGCRNTTRYLLPLSPLLSLLIVYCFSLVDGDRLARCLRFLARTLSFVSLMMASALVAMIWQLGAKVEAGLVLLMWLGAAVGIYWLERHVASRQLVFLLGGGMFVAWPLLFVSLQVVLPDSGGDAARILKALPNIETKPVLYIGSPSSASRVRLSLKGKAVIEQHRRWPPATNLNHYSAVVLPIEQSDISELAGLSAKGEYIRGFDKIKVKNLILSVFDGGFKDYLVGNTLYYRVLSNS